MDKDRDSLSSVAPRTGARIETGPRRSAGRPARSLPARGRGSKPVVGYVAALSPGSLPARGRGSKPYSYTPTVTGGSVAPRTGARIETHRPHTWLAANNSRSPHGGADRNMMSMRIPPDRRCRSPHGGADRNAVTAPIVISYGSSLPARGRGSKRSGIKSIRG